MAFAYSKKMEKVETGSTDVTRINERDRWAAALAGAQTLLDDIHRSAKWMRASYKYDCIRIGGDLILEHIHILN